MKCNKVQQNHKRLAEMDRAKAVEFCTPFIYTSEDLLSIFYLRLSSYPRTRPKHVERNVAK